MTPQELITLVSRMDQDFDHYEAARHALRNHAVPLIQSLQSDLDAAQARIAELESALRLFRGAAYPCCKSIDPRGYQWSEAYLDQALTGEPR